MKGNCKQDVGTGYARRTKLDYARLCFKTERLSLIFSFKIV